MLNLCPANSLGRSLLLAMAPEKSWGSGPSQQLDAKAQHGIADVERVVLEICYEMFQDSLKHQESLLLTLKF